MVTDHQPLVRLLNNPLKNAPLRIERKRVKLMGFDFRVQHRPGKNNTADWKSRHPVTQVFDDNHDKIESYVNMVTELKGIKVTTLEEVKCENKKDGLLQKVIHTV